MIDYEKYPELTTTQVHEAFDFAIEQIRRNLPEFTYKCQSSNSVNNHYYAEENLEWTTGFWPGEIWLAYERTGDPVFSLAGQIFVQSFLHRIENKIEVDHHDMGFLYSLSCVSAYHLTGDEDARTAAILAADQLASRWNAKGKFIQAWGPYGSPDHNRLIIDCLLNLGLLFWASEETGKPHYKDLAVQHIDTTLKNAIRDNGSAYHTYYFDVETGAPLRGVTHQGYKDESSWARGQAWAIYGTAISYRYTGIEKYREYFEKTLAYFIQRLPENLVPYWDLDFVDGSGEPLDSSASSIVACGLLEMADRTESPEDKRRYRKLASALMAAVIQECAVKDHEISNGLVLNGTYAKHSEYNGIPKDRGVDECVSWGDYYYMEALTRLSTNWEPYW